MNSLTFAILTICACAYGRPFVKTDEHSGATIGTLIPTVLVIGAELRLLDNVLLFTDEVNIYFPIPDVPPPRSAGSKSCSSSESFCVLQAENSKMITEEFDVLRAVHNIFTQRGLLEVEFREPEDKVKDPRILSEPAPLTIEQIQPSAVKSLNEESWMDETVQILSKRNAAVVPYRTSARKRRWAWLASAAKFVGPVIRKLIPEIMPLFVGENGLLKGMLGDRRKAKSIVQPIKKLGTTISEFSYEEQDTLRKFATSTNTFDDNYKEQGYLAFGASAEYVTSLRNTLQGTLSNVADLAALSLQSILYSVHLTAITECRSGHIPLAFLSPAMLEKRVRVLQDQMKTKFKIAMPDQATQFYFRRKSAACIFDNQGGLLQVKVPVIPAGSAYKLFEYEPLAFAWDNNTCHIHTSSQLVAQDTTRGNVIPISMVAAESCRPGTQYECKIPKVSLVDEGTSCLKTLLQGQTTYGVKETCRLHCSSGRNLVVNPISPSIVIVTHLPDTGAKIVCPEQQPLLVVHHVTKGALRVKLPPMCDLILNGKVVASGEGEVGDILLPELEHLLPWSWSTLDDLILQAGAGFKETKFSHDEDIINLNYFETSSEDQSFYTAYNSTVFKVWNVLTFIVVM